MKYQLKPGADLREMRAEKIGPLVHDQTWEAASILKEEGEIIAVQDWHMVLRSSTTLKPFFLYYSHYPAGWSFTYDPDNCTRLDSFIEKYFEPIP